MINGKKNNIISVFNKNIFEIRIYTIIIDDNNEEKNIKCGENLYKGEIEEKNKIFIKPVKVSIINSSNTIFSLEDDNSDFMINPKNGILSIENEEFLTIQNVGEKFNISVFGNDKNDNQITCIVEIVVHPEGKNNVNKIPKFKLNEYNFTISPGIIDIGKIEVIPSKNKFIYEIIEGSSDRMMIDRETGNLSYIGKPIIENEKIKIMVMARNEEYHEYVSFVPVNINFQGLYSKSPKFSDNDKVSLIIIDRHEDNVLLKKFNATDEDATEELIYNIESIKILNKLRNEVISNIEKEINKFKIENNTLLLNEMIKEDISNVEIIISVKDLSHVMEPKDYLYIVIIFKNNNDENKHDYLTLLEHPDTIFIDEGIKKDEYVYTIQPKQIPKSLEQLIGNNISSNYDFKIIEGNGYIINKSTGVIKTENIPTEDTNLLIEVEDLNTNNLVETRLNVNIVKKKKKNLSKRYEFMVREDVKEGYIIGYLENSKYYLSGDDSSKFKINNNNQLILISSLDYELQNDYLFFYGTNEVRIHVLDVNDNIPITDRLNISIILMDNIQPGTILDRLNITDLDKNDFLRFTFIGDNIITSKLFIDDHYNIITRESFINISTDNINFQIICSDGLHKISIFILLNIIKSITCNPIFIDNDKRIFNVDENMFGNLIIGSVKGVTGINCPIKYDILIDDEETDLPFMIDNNNGSIILKDFLDYEKKDNYKFKVKISSEKKENTAYYQIKVVDKNDHTPEFITHSSVYTIPEDFYVGEIITKVEAIDKDVNDQIYYHLTSGSDKFFINQSTGEIYLQKPLDKEQTDKYILNIFATNDEFLMLDIESSFDKMIITINIEDINDNGPIFDIDNYEIVIGKDMNPGEKIYQLHTHDLDNERTINNVKFEINDVRFHYKGHSREAPSYIFINKNGEIILNNYIDDFSGGFITATVTANDISTLIPSLTSKCYLKIWICSKEYLTNIILFNGPMEINLKKSMQLIKRLGDKVESTHVLLQSYGYYQNEDIFFDNKTIAKVVFIRDGEEMLLNDDVIRELKKDVMKFGNDEFYDLEKNNDNFERFEFINNEEDISILKIIIIIFLLTLLLIISSIIYIMLRDRNNFLLQKQNFIDEEIVAMTKENNNIFALSKPKYGEIYYLGRKESLSTFHTSQLYGDDSYSIQTLKINVGKRNDDIQIPYIEEID
ncbi:Protocadherin-23 [Strongyloides ratti]|uniref:Protocadherin-23 n=1 Tax=Strongyloides ratti TaxID=34506 RepID=A0A090LS53_STRRB|nr:Protocadherin-23 [Strongyloides ratti]CEF70428.1 Protocadherin-23 [Strongyloides ratti]